MAGLAHDMPYTIFSSYNALMRLQYDILKSSTCNFLIISNHQSISVRIVSKLQLFYD